MILAVSAGKFLYSVFLVLCFQTYTFFNIPLSPYSVLLLLGGAFLSVLIFFFHLDDAICSRQLDIQLETAGDSMASDSAQYKIRVCLDTRLLLIADTCTCVAEPNLHAQQGAV